MKDYHNQFPLIETKLLDGNYRDIEKWILNGEVDISFVNLPTQEKLEVIQLKKDRMLCIMPSNHVLGEQ